jgi:cell division protease FtsH
MLDEMCSLVAGRVAEEIINGQPSTGALNDLERLTKMAYGMVSYYGMSEKVGTLSFYDSTGSRGYDLTKPYSEKTAELIDKEVKELIGMIHDRTESILKDNFEGFTRLAELLLEKEVIFAEDLEKIFGPRVGAKQGTDAAEAHEDITEQPGE